MHAFRLACESGDLDGLVAILDPEVASVSDGGGKVRAALRPVVGADNVARYLLGVLRKAPDLTVEESDVNGELGLVVSAGDLVVGTISLGTVSVGSVSDRAAPDGGAGRIRNIWIVVNPDKLEAWNRTEQPPEPPRGPRGPATGGRRVACDDRPRHPLAYGSRECRDTMRCASLSAVAGSTPSADTVDAHAELLARVVRLGRVGLRRRAGDRLAVEEPLPG